MAGECCGPRCGYCGACDAEMDDVTQALYDDTPQEPAHVCLYCYSPACAGGSTCEAYCAEMDQHFKTAC